MIVKCRNGFYKFYPQNRNEIYRFNVIYGLNLVKTGDFFTPEVIAKLNNYYFKGQVIGGVVLSTSCFDKQTLFDKNDITFDITKNEIVNQNSIQTSLSYGKTSGIIKFPKLPQAYGFLEDQSRMSSFWAMVDKLSVDVIGVNNE